MHVESRRPKDPVPRPFGARAAILAPDRVGRDGAAGAGSEIARVLQSDAIQCARSESPSLLAAPSGDPCGPCAVLQLLFVTEATGRARKPAGRHLQNGAREDASVLSWRWAEAAGA
jgi:hypothetical protein